MKVLFTGGGTAGHVSPAIAIAELLQKSNSLDECLFVGRLNGDENKAVLKKGYKLSEIKVMPIKRKLSIESITAVINMISAQRTAKKILRDFSPDIVIATGGYVSYPILRAALKMHIPAVIHESNAYPGLVTRLLGHKCDAVLLGMGIARDYLPKCKNIVESGNPISSEFGSYGFFDARRKLGIKENEKLIVSFGGSGGADRLNESIIEMMKSYSLITPSIRHIHATGRRSYEKIKTSYPELFTKEKTGCKILPYIENMPILLSAADLAITRSGAMTVSELVGCKVKSILIPSPNVAANHQYYNALWAEKTSGAIIIEEKDLSKDSLVSKVKSSLSKSDSRKRFIKYSNSQNNSQIESIITETLQNAINKRK